MNCYYFRCALLIISYLCEFEVRESRLLPLYSLHPPVPQKKQMIHKSENWIWNWRSISFFCLFAIYIYIYSLSMRSDGGVCWKTNKTRTKSRQLASQSTTTNFFIPSYFIPQRLVSPLRIDRFWFSCLFFKKIPPTNRMDVMRERGIRHGSIVAMLYPSYIVFVLYFTRNNWGRPRKTCIIDYFHTWSPFYSYLCVSVCVRVLICCACLCCRVCVTRLSIHLEPKKKKSSLYTYVLIGQNMERPSESSRMNERYSTQVELPNITALSPFFLLLINI